MQKLFLLQLLFLLSFSVNFLMSQRLFIKAEFHLPHVAPPLKMKITFQKCSRYLTVKKAAHPFVQLFHFFPWRPITFLSSGFVPCPSLWKSKLYNSSRPILCQPIHFTIFTEPHRFSSCVNNSQPTWNQEPIFAPVHYFWICEFPHTILLQENPVVGPC